MYGQKQTSLPLNVTYAVSAEKLEIDLALMEYVSIHQHLNTSFSDTLEMRERN